MDSMNMLKGSVALIIKLINVFVHSLGLHLLCCLCKKGEENVQMIYIMNLSVTELIINIFSFSRNFARLLPCFNNFHNSSTYEDVEMYSYILDYLLKFCLYMWMLFITIDRVCGVLLNFKYASFWNITKAKCLVGATWLFGLTILTYIAVTYSLKSSTEKIVHKAQLFQSANYFVMVFDFSFVATAVCAYLFIFYRYQKSRRNRFIRKISITGRSKNLLRVFQHSRFYVSVLLISAYIIFTIIPDLLWTFKVVRSDTTQFVLTIMYAFSHLADGVIYIMMHDRVKKMLYKKLDKYSCFRMYARKLSFRSSKVSRNGFSSTYSDKSPAVEETNLSGNMLEV